MKTKIYKYKKCIWIFHIPERCQLELSKLAIFSQQFPSYNFIFIQTVIDSQKIVLSLIAAQIW